MQARNTIIRTARAQITETAATRAFLLPWFSVGVFIFCLNFLGDIAFVDVTVHGVVARFLEEWPKFTNLDALNSFAEQATADSSVPCALDLILQFFLGQRLEIGHHDDVHIHKYNLLHVRVHDGDDAHALLKAPFQGRAFRFALKKAEGLWKGFHRVLR